MNIEILNTAPDHIAAIKHSLRFEDEKELIALGTAPSSVLWQSYKRSILRRTALIDGEVAAVWGCGGSWLGSEGAPWLLTSIASERISPLRFVRIYQEEVIGMLDLFPKLVNWVDASYTKAVRLLDIIGFTLGEPEPVGAHNALFRRFEMKRAT